MTKRSLALALGAWASLGANGLAGCAADEELGSAQLGLIGESLPGITPEEFAANRDAFDFPNDLESGLGPIFNETACGTCHNQGASGGAGTQIESRFGTFVDGVFDEMASAGGSTRQLFTVGAFTGLDGQHCDVPLEVAPAGSIRASRVTQPLFGLGLVDAMPDAFFDRLAAFQPPAIRGMARRVTVELPDPNDPTQTLRGLRVGRFGWKAQIPNLVQFSADAYVNEVGITSQSCFHGVSVVTFATEPAPSGVPVPVGCDDLMFPAPFGAPPGTDDAVGSCAGGLTEIHEALVQFTRFMTFLAPPPREPNTPAIARGALRFAAAGCGGCHVMASFVTPSSPHNGVPGSFAFQPFSDFLVHDMGPLGDLIGVPGDSRAMARRVRTAPLWGIRFRTLLLHDGRTTSIRTAIQAHDGQGRPARDRFNALARNAQDELIAFVHSL
jgi:CxxC motif-containing protein (DUF1111 family)